MSFQINLAVRTWITLDKLFGAILCFLTVVLKSFFGLFFYVLRQVPICSSCLVENAAMLFYCEAPEMLWGL